MTRIALCIVAGWARLPLVRFNNTDQVLRAKLASIAAAARNLPSVTLTGDGLGAVTPETVTVCAGGGEAFLARVEV